MDDSYVVYGFNVCAAEPWDAMEDLGFVDLMRVFTSLNRARKFAEQYVSRVKSNEEGPDDHTFRCDDPDDDMGMVTVHYVSPEIQSEDDVAFGEFNGHVVVVRRVSTDDDELSSIEDLSEASE